jgi:hypothetical protein
VRGAKVVKTECSRIRARACLMNIADTESGLGSFVRVPGAGKARAPSGNRTRDRSTSTLSVINTISYPGNYPQCLLHSRCSNATRPPPYRLHSPRHKRGSPFSSLLGKICSSAKQFATYKARGRRRGGRYTKANVRIDFSWPEEMVRQIDEWRKR